MICMSCGDRVYRSYTYYNGDKLVKNVCDECYPEGRVNSIMNSPRNKIKSRSLMPDGTVLSGNSGIKELDRRRRKQAKHD